MIEGQEQGRQRLHQPTPKPGTGDILRPGEESQRERHFAKFSQLIKFAEKAPAGIKTSLVLAASNLREAQKNKDEAKQKEIKEQVENILEQNQRSKAVRNFYGAIVEEITDAKKPDESTDIGEESGRREKVPTQAKEKEWENNLSSPPKSKEEAEWRLDQYYLEHYHIAEKFRTPTYTPEKRASWLFTPENLVAWLQHPDYKIFIGQALKKYYELRSQVNDKDERGKERGITGLIWLQEQILEGITDPKAKDYVRRLMEVTGYGKEGHQLRTAEGLYGYKTLLEFCLEGLGTEQYLEDGGRRIVKNDVTQNVDEFINSLKTTDFEKARLFNEDSWWDWYISKLIDTRLWLEGKPGENRNIDPDARNENFGFKGFVKEYEETGKFRTIPGRETDPQEIYLDELAEAPIFNYLPDQDQAAVKNAFFDYITKEVVSGLSPWIIRARKGDRVLYSRDGEAIAEFTKARRQGLGVGFDRKIFRECGIIGENGVPRSWTEIKRQGKKDQLPAPHIARLLLQYLDKEHIFWLFTRDEKQFHYIPDLLMQGWEAWEEYGPFREAWNQDEWYRVLCGIALEIVDDDKVDGKVPGTKVVRVEVEKALNNIKSLPGLNGYFNSSTPEQIQSLENDKKEARKLLLAQSGFLPDIEGRFYFGCDADLHYLIYLSIIKKMGLFDGRFQGGLFNWRHRFLGGQKLEIVEGINKDLRSLKYQYGAFKDKPLVEKTNYIDKDSENLVESKKDKQLAEHRGKRLTNSNISFLWSAGDGYDIWPEVGRRGYSSKYWDDPLFLPREGFFDILRREFSSYSREFWGERWRTIDRARFAYAFTPKDDERYIDARLRMGHINNGQAEILKDVLGARDSFPYRMKMFLYGFQDTETKGVPGESQIKNLEAQVGDPIVKQVLGLVKGSEKGWSGLQLISGIAGAGTMLFAANIGAGLAIGLGFPIALQLGGNTIIRWFINRSETPAWLEAHDALISPEEMAGNDAKDFAHLSASPDEVSIT